MQINLPLHDRLLVVEDKYAGLPDDYHLDGG
jgi:hypothetical protein